jgi:hypothetical protein
VNSVLGDELCEASMEQTPCHVLVLGHVTQAPRPDPKLHLPSVGSDVC